MSNQLRSIIGFVCLYVGIAGSTIATIKGADTFTMIFLFIASTILAYIGIGLIETEENNNDTHDEENSGPGIFR